MVQLLLFLHVLGAIIVFGPSFAFPLIAGQARKAPFAVNRRIGAKRRWKRHDTDER